MNTKNTKDPINILREALEEIALRMPDSIMSRIAKDALAVTEGAAIQHGESNETKPAGEAVAWMIWNAFDNKPLKTVYSASEAAEFHPDHVRPMSYASPVSTPAPEAAGWFIEIVNHDGSKTICSVRQGVEGAFQLFKHAAPVPEAKDEQAERCKLRLCCKADAHAADCDTYDKGRYPDEQSIESAAINLGLIGIVGDNPNYEAKLIRLVQKFAAPAVFPPTSAVKHEASELPAAAIGLHDDGYFTWRNGGPHEARYAGWKGCAFTADQVYEAIFADRVARSPVASYEAPSTKVAAAPDTVRIPTTADEAQMMANLGLAYLKDHAPERLKAAPDTSTRDAAITDDQMIGVMHYFGIDTSLSLYGFSALQVSGSNIPHMKEIVTKCIACIQSGEWPEPIYDFDGDGNVVYRTKSATAASISSTKQT